MRVVRILSLAVSSALLVVSCGSQSACGPALVPGGASASTSERHVVIALDRSQSMQYLATEVISSFNQMLSVLPSGTHVSLVQFDSVRGAEITHSLLLIEEIGRLSAESYTPDGGTPLYDAIDTAIRLGDRGMSVLNLASGAATMLAIISDGEENSSIFATRAGLRSDLADRLAAGWDVRFFGLGVSATREAAALGLPSSTVSELATDAAAVSDIFEDIGGGFASGSPRC